MATVPPAGDAFHPSTLVPVPAIVPKVGYMGTGALDTTQKVGGAAQPVLLTAGGSSPMPPLPPAAGPALPPIFDKTLQSEELIGRITQVNDDASKHVATMLSPPPQTADKIAQEDYALAQFHRNVNDALKTGGFQPIFKENKILFMGKEIVFLQDRVVIPGATVGEGQQLIAALKAAATGPTAPSQLSPDQIALIKKLQPGTAKDLDQTHVNTANAAAREAANTYLNHISGRANSMGFVDQARVQAVAGIIQPTTHPGVPQKKPWDPIVLAQMTRLSDTTFRGLVRIETARLQSPAGAGSEPKPPPAAPPAKRDPRAGGRPFNPSLRPTRPLPPPPPGRGAAPVTLTPQSE